MPEIPQSTIDITRAIPLVRGYNIEPGFSQWQLDPKDVIEFIEHALRGEVWSPDPKGGGIWKIPAGMSPTLNELGIQAILKRIMPVVNRVVIMSNLEEKTINDWLFDIECNLSDQLFLMIKVWEVSREDLDSIMDNVILLTEASLKRALMDGERRKIYESQRHIESVTVDKSSGRGGGLLSFIPGFGGHK